MSSSRSAPTFTLNFVHPLFSASEQSCRKNNIWILYIQSGGLLKLRHETHLSELLVRIAQPRTGSGVGRITLLQHLLLCQRGRERESERDV